MSKKFYILSGTILLIIIALVFFKETMLGSSLLWNVSTGGNWLFPLIVVSALIDSINPCAFSVLLITIAFLFSAGAARVKMLKVGGAYIFGIFVVYVLIGLGLLKALSFFGVPHFMSKVGASLIILFGIIALIDHYFPNFPIKFKIPSFAHSRMASLIEKGSAVAAFVLGGLVALCEFPCTGGPYLTALGLLHDQATYLSGLFYLVLYNIIFVAPLVIILLLGSESSFLGKLESWKKNNTGTMKVVTGLAMLILGAIILLL